MSGNTPTEVGPAIPSNPQSDAAQAMAFLARIQRTIVTKPDFTTARTFIDTDTLADGDGLCAASSMSDPDELCPNPIDQRSADMCTAHYERERSPGTWHAAVIGSVLAYRERRREAQYAALAATSVDIEDEDSLDVTLARLRAAKRLAAQRRRDARTTAVTAES